MNIGCDLVSGRVTNGEVQANTEYNRNFFASGSLFESLLAAKVNFHGSRFAMNHKLKRTLANLGDVFVYQPSYLFMDCLYTVSHRLKGSGSKQKQTERSRRIKTSCPERMKNASKQFVYFKGCFLLISSHQEPFNNYLATISGYFSL